MTGPPAVLTHLLGQARLPITRLLPRILLCTVTLLPAAVAQLPDTGDFEATYNATVEGQARTAAPTPTAIAGVATLRVYLAQRFSVLGSAQTVVSTNTPQEGTSGSTRTTGYGETRLELTGTVFHKDVASPNAEVRLNRNLQLDYTLIFPPGGAETPGTETYAHQFLAKFLFDRSLRTSFEVDAGDYMGPRATQPGYEHTAQLALVAARNWKKDGSSPGTFDLEIDASPSSQDSPASLVAVTGVTRALRDNLQLSVEALTGLTANDPAIGLSVVLLFRGNLAKKGEAPSTSDERKQQYDYSIENRERNHAPVQPGGNASSTTKNQLLERHVK